MGFWERMQEVLDKSIETSKDVIEKAKNAGLIFVASAGNDGNDTDVVKHYPSSYNLLLFEKLNKRTVLGRYCRYETNRNH